MLLANVRLGLVLLKFLWDITGFEAVPIEESSELLSGNIGETPEMDNTEINSEIKESESSYSVEVETNERNYNYRLD